MRLDDLSQKQIEELNRRELEKTEKDFKEFKKDLAKGICWVCKRPLDSFDESNPCQHWLLLPEGFRKKHFKALFEAKTIDMIEGFLRWYANAHEPIRNINNLKEEHDGKKLKALTIKHGNLEWSFSMSKGCFAGTHGSHGPHYHFQMRVDGKPFHDYSDRHIRLSEYEKWILNIEHGKHPKIKKIERHGAGMQDLLDNVGSEKILESMQTAGDPDSAMFNISSVVMAADGDGISGDDFNALLKEHRETGAPLHQLVKKLKNVNTTVIVEPGKGVPEAAQRTRRHKRRPSR